MGTALNCEREGLAIAEAADLSARLDECKVAAKELGPEDLEIPTQEGHRAKAKAKTTKDIILVEGDPSKTTKIGADLDPK